MDTPPNPELEALRAELNALRSTVERPRRARFWLLGAALALTSTFAVADLITFTPDTPAKASEVNANFEQLKTWLEAKTGLVTQPFSAASISLGASGPVTLTSNGAGQLLPSGGLALPDGTGITSHRFGVSIPVSQAGAALTFVNGALEGTFVDNGGTIVILASATAYCSAVGRITMNVLVDGQIQGRMRLYCDRVNSHMAFPAALLRLNRTNLAVFPTTRTVRLEPLSCASGCNPGLVTATADVNDFGEVTVLRLPTP